MSPSQPSRFGRLLLLLVYAALGLAMTSCRNSSQAGAPEDLSAAAANGTGVETEVLDGIPVGFTEDGLPFRGDPQAPVTIYEYSDYLCPFCGRHNNESMPALLDQYARTGRVRFVFHDFPIESLHPTADLGHVAANCAGRQSASLYFRLHDELFARQDEWSRLPEPGDFLASLAEEVGVDERAFAECVNAEGEADLVAQRVQAAVDLGFNATPTFRLYATGADEPHLLVGALPVDTYQSWFDALAAGNSPPVDATPTPQPLPPWATAEGLAPDPERPGFTAVGDPFIGDPAAPLVIAEFSDFACPACATHALEALPAISAAMVETGRVRWVMKQLPLSEHRPASALAAVAAECAGEQGRYWEMHQLLFQTQAEWSATGDEAYFHGLADRLSLDAADFASCSKGRDALQRVMDDLFDAQDLGLGRTPSFVFIHEGRASLFQGALDGERFVTLLEGFLERGQENASAEAN